MRASTSVCMGVRAASSWKPMSLAVAWTDGRPTPSPVGWMELCFNHPVVCYSLSLSLSLTTPTFPLSPCCLYIGMSLVRRRRQSAIYASEQVCIWWHRTGACYTDKLTFSHGSSIKVWGAYYTNVRIIFKFSR